MQVAGWQGCPGCVFGIEGSLRYVTRGGTAWKRYWYLEGEAVRVGGCVSRRGCNTGVWCGEFWLVG